MIADECQYRISSAAVREFEEALTNLDTVEAHRAPEMRRLIREAIESQIEELWDDLAAYEVLRTASVSEPGLETARPAR